MLCIFFEISEIIVYFLFSILAIGIIHGDRKRKIRVESEFKNRADDAIDNKLSDYYSSEIDAKKLADIKNELTTLIMGIGGSYNCPGFYILVIMKLIFMLNHTSIYRD
ncbi:hypothetical protein bplSymb_SCF04302P015 [Bathymodiolus platifrons methanotrophic gill symbiont]|nr:hypothetical protein bplSymb_SCF04302P015 [Bathymodiolus platifrons methanotrophic gill symbiont]